MNKIMADQIMYLYGLQLQSNYKVSNDFRYIKSLVVVMVDLLDFPCSIWPGIVDIIGTDRPIIIVGNKVCF